MPLSREQPSEGEHLQHPEGPLGVPTAVGWLSGWFSCDLCVRVKTLLPLRYLTLLEARRHTAGARGITICAASGRCRCRTALTLFEGTYYYDACGRSMPMAN